MAKRDRRRRGSGTTKAEPPGVPQIQDTDVLSKPSRLDLLRNRLSELSASAIPTAYQLFWTTVYVVIGGAMTASTVAFLVYLKSPNALWLYPYFHFAAGFFGACVLIIVLSVLLTLLRSYQAAHTTNAQFASDEKGFLDHIVNRARAEVQMTKALALITRELQRIRTTSHKSTKKTTQAKGNPFKGLRIASTTAKRMNRHSARMENHLAQFEEMSDLLVESGRGYIEWLTPDSEEAKTQLLVWRGLYASLLEGTRGSRESMEFYRDATVGLKGTSQELNGAVNRMVNVTNGIIAAHHKTEPHWADLIAIIDRKLAAQG